MSKTGIIYGVNGPVIYLKGDTGFKISEMVYVGPEKPLPEQETQFPFSLGRESSTIFLMVSRGLLQKLQRPPENIFPAVSVLIPLILRKNGKHTSQ